MIKFVGLLIINKVLFLQRIFKGILLVFIVKGIGGGIIKIILFFWCIIVFLEVQSWLFIFILFWDINF